MEAFREKFQRDRKPCCCEGESCTHPFLTTAAAAFHILLSKRKMEDNSVHSGLSRASAEDTTWIKMWLYKGLARRKSSSINKAPSKRRCLLTRFLKFVSFARRHFSSTVGSHGKHDTLSTSTKNMQTCRKHQTSTHQRLLLALRDANSEQTHEALCNDNSIHVWQWRHRAPPRQLPVQSDGARRQITSQRFIDEPSAEILTQWCQTRDCDVSARTGEKLRTCWQHGRADTSRAIMSIWRRVPRFSKEPVAAEKQYRGTVH